MLYSVSVFVFFDSVFSLLHFGEEYSLWLPEDLCLAAAAHTVAALYI